MKTSLNLNLPKRFKLGYLLFFCLIILPLVGVDIPNLILWVIVNNLSLMLILNLENGKRTFADFLEPKLLFLIVSILNCFILYRVL